jgi:hypothetical protein
VTEIAVSEVSPIVHPVEQGVGIMPWIDRARAMLHAMNGISLPDPDRIDVGSVPDTARLLEAIDAAMPRTAVLHLIGPRHKALLPFLATRSVAIRRSTGEYWVSLEDGAVGDLARVAAGCPPDEVCAHIFVQDGEQILLEAFGRDRGEDVVWLSRRLPKASFHRFLEVIAGTPQISRLRPARPIVRQSGSVRVLSLR